MCHEVASGPVSDSHIAQFAALVNRTWSFGRAMTADAAGEGELAEEFAEPLNVLTLFRINFRIGAFEIGGSENSGRTVAGAGEKNHVEIVFLDQAVQMDIDKRKSGARSPMAQQTILDVLGLQRFGEQRVVAKVDHSQTEIVAGSPVDFGFAQFFCIQRFIFDGRPRRSIRAEFEDFGWAAGFDRAHRSLLLDSLVCNLVDDKCP
jgi:hypothetical protein